jgi:hypothetical protein
MKRDEQGQDSYVGQPLPGTGGEMRKDVDVEGHRARQEPEGAKREDTDEMRKDDDVEGHRARQEPESAHSDDDVEGHRAR